MELGAPSMYQLTKKLYEDTETIPHKEIVKNYTVTRPMLWFCKNDRVSLDDMLKYFSIDGVASLIQYDYVVRDSTTIKPEIND